MSDEIKLSKLIFYVKMVMVIKLNYLKILKMSLGFVLATIISNYFNLNYAVSAGIVALLSIQETKKETLQIGVQRFLSFTLALILAIVVFKILGFNPYAFGVLLFFFIAFSMKFNLESGIAMNSVIATHYLIEQSMSLEWIKNEFSIFSIGVMIGILLNLYMPSYETDIKAEQIEIENTFKKILYQMSTCILNNHKTGILYEKITDLENKINDIKQLAYHNMNNRLLDDTKYQLSYLEMRYFQCLLLQHIYDQMMKMDFIPLESQEIADFFNQLANCFHEHNEASLQIKQLHELKQHYKQSSLPTSRIEFENRSHLMQIIDLLEQFLNLKYQFVLNLTDQEKNKYWII
ncbi:MAG: aromatic acid exporter family protein [Beduini sp.]